MAFFVGLARSIETSELYSLSPISIGRNRQIRPGQIRENVGAERELILKNDNKLMDGYGWWFPGYNSKTLVGGT